MKIAILLLVNIIASFLVHALEEEQDYTPESKLLLSKMQQQIQGTLLTISEYERKAGNDMSNFNYEIKLPEQQKVHLGLVLETNNPNKGYKVLSITPGSIADMHNIITGDTIKVINGIEINETNHAKAIEQLKQLVIGSLLELTIESEGKGKIKNISSNVVANYIPEIKLEIGSKPILAKSESDATSEQNGCGQIKLPNFTSVSKDIYPLLITQVNGRNKIAPGRGSSLPSTTGPHGLQTVGDSVETGNYSSNSKNNYKLKVGKNIVKLTSPGAEKRLSGIKLRSYKYTKVKLELMIEKNKKYYFVAQVDKKTKSWEPILIKETDEECELAWYQK